MSQKNVVEIVRRKSDGTLWEVLYKPLKQWYIEGFTWIRMGPAGQPRSKRKWIPIADAMTHYESQPTTPEEP